MELSMRSDGRLDVACRYIPHDQWITTHIEPTWKIRVVKQWILSKCTGAPFDAPPLQAPLHVHVPAIRQSRKRAHGSKKTPTEAEDSTGGGERPVSPITFAPDPRQRPISPILFAKAGTVGKERRRPKEAVADDAGLTWTGASTPTTSGADGGVGDVDEVAEEKDDDKGGYEEDDEWDTAEDFDDEDEDDDLDTSLSPASLEPLPMGGPVLPASKKLLPALHSSHNGKIDPTLTGTYTLMRFSTGQILEDDYFVSWYNLAPHELLELHSHVIQPPQRPPQAPGPKHTRNASIFSTTTSGQTDAPHTHEKRYLPRLNRTSLSTYVMPYFEGWVLALRVVWREEDLLPPSFYGTSGGFAGTGFRSGQVHAIESAYGLPGDRIRGRRRGQREGGVDKTTEELGGGQGSQGRAGKTTSLQWRPRWLVVKEGWVRLYRTREETTPTHDLPLSALMTLRGEEHLIRGPHHTPKAKNGRNKPHREHGAGSVHGHDTQSIHTASIQGTTRNPRSLSLSRSQSRSGSRTGHHDSDSHSDGHTPGGAAALNKEKHRDRGKAKAHGQETTGVVGPSRGEAEEERRVVCMKFRNRNAWAVPPPSKPVPRAGELRRYASTLAGYGGGTLDGHGMGITSFVTVGHGAAEKDGKGKGKGKEKEKEDKKLKGKPGKEKKEGRLDKRSLDRALAIGTAGSDGQGPYLQKSSVSGAGVSSKTFVGAEGKEKGRTRAFGGKSKEKNKEKESDGVMSLGMSLGLGLGFTSVLNEKKKVKGEKKLQKLGQTGSRATLNSQATTSTAVSSWAPGTTVSHATTQTVEAASSSSHARSGVSSGDDERMSDPDEEGTVEEGEGYEEGTGGRWASLENDDDTSSGGEVRFAPLSSGARVVSDDDADDDDDYNYEASANSQRMLTKVVSDEDDVGGSVPSDLETVSHKPSHPQVDLGSVSDSESVALSDPVFAHSDVDCSDDDDGLGCMEGVDADGKHRYGYRFGYRYETIHVKKDSTELETTNTQKEEKEDQLQKARLKEESRRKERERKEKEKGEWVILDMGADLAYSSFLRILHRHFPPPISSSFLSGFPAFSSPTPLSTPTPTPTPTPFPSPTSPHPPVSGAPFLWPSSPGSSSGKADDIQMGIHDPEPPSPLSTSSRSSRFHSDPPQHPPALAALAVNTPLPVPKTFGALPYPEWRIEIVERAQKSGMGDVGRAMRWVLWGNADQLAEDLAEMQSRKEEGDEANVSHLKTKGRMRSSTLKNRRQSTASTVEVKPGSISDSDVSEDTGKMLMNTSDSEGESSEAEWHGWMADLHRQHGAQAQKEREAAEAALRPQSEGEAESEEAPPRNLAEDQRRYQEKLRALEPYAVVSTSPPSVSAATSVVSTPSTTLHSPSSSESLAHRHRARALSFSPVDASESSATTSNPPSSHSHQHTPSTSPLANPQDRKHHLPPGASLSHSTSLYASGLRNTYPEQSLRRPSMPTLAAEQTFSLAGASITPQISILRSPASSTFTFPAAGASGSRSPPFSPAPSSSFGPQEPLPHTIVSSTVTTEPATMPRRASSAGLMNIGSVGGSLGRSSSVLTRPGGLLKKDAVKEAERAREKGREKERKAKDKEDKAREKEEKAKEKERVKDRGKEKEREKEKPKSRPKLSLATSGSPPTNNSTYVEQVPPYQVKSPKMESIMRRVRSGSNLRQTEPEAEPPTSPIREGYGGSSSKKKGVLVHGVERIVRGLDSALDFVDGKS